MKNKDSINIPYAVFMRTSLVAVFDNLKNTISIVKIVNKPKNIINKKKINDLYEKNKKKINRVISLLEKPLRNKKKANNKKKENRKNFMQYFKKSILQSNW